MRALLFWEKQRVVAQPESLPAEGIVENETVTVLGWENLENREWGGRTYLPTPQSIWRSEQYFVQTL